MLKNIKIKMARLEKEMTQQDLAERIGVTRQTIGLIEAGNYNPTIKLCLKICYELDKSLDELFWEDKENEE
ncbi:helix-turn-helix transcriptional regulator [Atopobacter phocae]|uniref:helix-turn-helix transcriptional regulator n=1 Tax=Atopobacter phocae TaxID=136492 RepID=UPI00316ADB8E